MLVTIIAIISIVTQQDYLKIVEVVYSLKQVSDYNQPHVKEDAEPQKETCEG